jgi:hypothetical protein
MRLVPAPGLVRAREDHRHEMTDLLLPLAGALAAVVAVLGGWLSLRADRLAEDPLISYGVSTIWTNDRDFRVYDGITVRNPFDERYASGFD